MSLLVSHEEVAQCSRVTRRPRRAARRRVAAIAADIAALALANVAVGSWLPGYQLGVLLSGLFALTFWYWIAAARLYNSRLVTNRRLELTRVLRSGTRAVLGIALLAMVAGPNVAVRSLAILWAASVVAVLLEREMFRIWFKGRRRSGRSLWGTILLADEEGGKLLKEAIHANHTSYYKIVSHVCPGRASDPEALLTMVLAAARESDANGVMVVESSLDTVATNFVVRGLLEADLYVDLASSLAGISTDRLATRNLGPSIATWIEPRPRNGWRSYAKRAFDVFVATLAVVATAPLFLLTAVAVKVSSTGPILFRQERVGRDGLPFEILKFRSMEVEAEWQLDKLMGDNEGAGPLFKMKSDPRLTRIGSFIRRTSLDELPQLINVLRDDMSLVGPRPALPSEMMQWQPDLFARLNVKPGITGMWQVSGRSAVSFDEYTRLDLYYVHNWSLFEDLTILLKTIPAVIRSDGAH